MKKNKLFISIALLVLGILLGYFLAQFCKSEKARIADNSNCSAPQLRQMTKTCAIKESDGTVGPVYDTTCCRDFDFCGVPRNMLLGWIRNYAWRVFRKTSQFDGPILSRVDFDRNTNKLDARVVSMDFEQLDNYMCYVKKKAIIEGKTLKNMDVYYICYDTAKGGMNPNSYYTGLTIAGPDIPQHYPGVHSIAFIPSYFGQNGIVPWDTLSYAPGYSDCNSMIKNHGSVCPPPNCSDCGAEAILEEADQGIDFAAYPW